MQIRIAIEDDLEPLALMFNEYRKSLGRESDQQGANEFIESRLRENDSVIFIAILAGESVGFIQLYPSFSSSLLKPLWYFDDLFVVEPFREQGIARELVNKAKELADETQVLAVRRERLEGDGFVLIDSFSI
ncbi:GNAT family N-acetyltransferase [uncultured Shewanella sp.]|uniref:GNAT family N-acetyltransferase n=1 Tax=Shewanella atlantica TaxID=271099 RepID=UPI00260C616B|nr:GNAT family N-acetyltransferase [uncultured Shewanella sp.]